MCPPGICPGINALTADTLPSSVTSLLTSYSGLATLLLVTAAACVRTLTIRDATTPRHHKTPDNFFIDLSRNDSRIDVHVRKQKLLGRNQRSPPSRYSPVATQSGEV